MLLQGLTAFVFAVAFYSIIVQWDGLYSCDGIVPVHVNFGGWQKDMRSKTANVHNINDAMDLFWSRRWQPLEIAAMGANYVEYTADEFHHLLMQVGFSCAVLIILIAFDNYYNHNHKTPTILMSVLMFVCWFCYLIIFYSGQYFLSFQWDILLLEAGFVSIFLPHPLAVLQLRFVLFKLMFLSGVVKIQSSCPTWSLFTALDYHWQTQPLSTALSRFAYFHTNAFLRNLMVAGTFVVEGTATLLILVPTRRARILAAAMQIFFQINIAATGNYAFFNLHTAILCFSLFLPVLPPSSLSSPVAARVERVVDIVAIVATGLFSFFMFESTTASSWLLRLVPAVQPANLESVVTPFSQFAIILHLAVVLFVFASHVAAGDWEMKVSVIGKKVWFLLSSIFLIGLFLTSTVPLLQAYHSHDVVAVMPLPPQLANVVVNDWYPRTQPFVLTSSYGLFRRMTGVHPRDNSVARPEIIIEMSFDNKNKYWPIDFYYKPGRLNRTDSFVAPHQPRLDWQMWFAALSRYNNNPWFLNLAYKLLAGSKDVLALLPKQLERQFNQSKPQDRRIRAQLYYYNYTNLTDSSDGDKIQKRKHAMKEIKTDYPIADEKIVSVGPVWTTIYASEYVGVIEWQNIHIQEYAKQQHIDPDSVAACLRQNIRKR